jgi:hypothetical protein
MVIQVNPFLGISIFIYFISGAIMRFYLQIKGGRLISKKLDCLESLGIDKILLFMPEFVPLSVLKPIYEGLSIFDTEKYELEDYIKMLKIYRRIYVVPCFIGGSITLLYTFIRAFS